MHESPPLPKSLIEAAARIRRGETLNEGWMAADKIKKLEQRHPELAKAVKITGNQSPDMLKNMVRALSFGINSKEEDERLAAAKLLLKSQSKLNEELNEEISVAECKAVVKKLTEALIEVEQMVHANEMNNGTMGIVNKAIALGRKTY